MAREFCYNETIMRKDLVKRLDKKIDELKDLLKNIDAESILGQITIDLMYKVGETNLAEKTKLSSPYRQYMYLYALVVSEDRGENRIVTDADWEKIKSLLEEITYIYSDIFWPTKEELETGLDNFWKTSRELTMMSFIDYFNTFELNYEEQVLKRINRWYKPFTNEIKELLGFNLEEALEFYVYVKGYIEDFIEELYEIREEERKQRLDFLNNVASKCKSMDEIKKKAQLHPTKKAADKLINHVNKTFKIKIKDIEDKFGKELASKLINAFSITKSKRSFRYYTEDNPIIKKPLFLIDNNNLFYIQHKIVLNALSLLMYNTLKNSELEQRFYKHRSAQSEQEVVDILKRLFSDKAEYYSSIFEDQKSSEEHDCLIRYQDSIFIVEVKSGKVKEPFRDPVKSYVRLKRGFKSEEGIQGAYAQALKLKQRIISNEETILYDEDGNEIVKIERRNVNKIFLIVITAENYGYIATKLSFLEKLDSEPYPWCTDLYSLDTFINGLLEMGLKPEDFIYYLEKRAELNDKFISTDELEIAGYFLSYKNFDDIESGKFEKAVFSPEMSNIFDKFYFESKGIPYVLDQDEKPCMVDPREMIRKEIKGSVPKVGRNQPCPCGSGLKYKKLTCPH